MEKKNAWIENTKSNRKDKMKGEKFKREIWFENSCIKITTAYLSVKLFCFTFSELQAADMLEKIENQNWWFKIINNLFLGTISCITYTIEKIFKKNHVEMPKGLREAMRWSQITRSGNEKV